MSDIPESRTQREAPAPEVNTSTLPIYEEAKLCPRCKQPGELAQTVKNQPRPGAKVEVYECKSELCIGFRDRWLVQINADGTIPIRTQGPKEFEVAPKALDYGKAMVEQTKHQLAKGEVEPGSA